MGWLDVLVVINLGDLILNPLIQELPSLQANMQCCSTPVCPEADMPASHAVQVWSHQNIGRFQIRGKEAYQFVSTLTPDKPLQTS